LFLLSSYLVIFLLFLMSGFFLVFSILLPTGGIQLPFFSAHVVCVVISAAGFLLAFLFYFKRRAVSIAGGLFEGAIGAAPSLDATQACRFVVAVVSVIYKPTHMKDNAQFPVRQQLLSKCLGSSALAGSGHLCPRQSKSGHLRPGLGNR
jgi:hypothetical protein